MDHITDTTTKAVLNPYASLFVPTTVDTPIDATASETLVLCVEQIVDTYLRRMIDNDRDHTTGFPRYVGSYYVENGYYRGFPITRWITGKDDVDSREWDNPVFYSYCRMIDGYWKLKHDIPRHQSQLERFGHISGTEDIIRSERKAAAKAIIEALIVIDTM